MKLACMGQKSRVIAGLISVAEHYLRVSSERTDPMGMNVKFSILGKKLKNQKRPGCILNFEAWPITFLYSYFEAFLKPFALYNSIF